MQAAYGNIPNANDYLTYGAAIGGDFDYLLDNVPGAKMGLAVRNLRYSYAGNYSRIRRASDNSEQNIAATYKKFITENSILDNNLPLADWLNGSQGYGRTWPDQSGNNCHAQQNTANNQFILLQNRINGHPAYSGKALTDCIFNYDADKIGQVIYGEDKRFTWHFVANNNAVTGGDVRLFFHVEGAGLLIKGLHLNLNGSGLTGQYRFTIYCGNTTSYSVINTVNAFSNRVPRQFTVLYDGTIDTSWVDRFTLYVNGVVEPFQQITLNGPFPAAIAPSTFPARLWSANSSNLISEVSEAVLWDRNLSLYEIDFVYRNSKKVYGL